MGGATALTKRTPRFNPDLTVVQPPDGFPAFKVLPMPRVFRQGNGRFRGAVDLATLKPGGGTTYYVDRAGSAGNTGLSRSSPWPIATALNAVNAGSGLGDMVIMLSNASEYASTTWPTITKSCSIVADSPGVRATNWLSTGVTWTAYSGSAGVAGTIYGTPKVSTNGIFDVVNRMTYTDWLGRSYSDFTTYVSMGTGANQAAALALITADGQWALDGTNVYVRPIGAMDLTNSITRGNVRMRQAGGAWIIADGPGAKVYVRGIAWEGHANFRAQNNAIVVAEDCSFKYKLADGTTTDGGHEIFIRCLASSNGRDGFNRHDAAFNGTEFIEIDCVSGYNGLQDTNGNNNASTSHEDCHGIRIGGTYFRSTGPTIADVNDARSWNLGCDARDSIAPISTDRVNYITDTTAQMWLDECSSNGLNVNGGSGSGYNFKANGSTAKIHRYGFRGEAWPMSADMSAGGVYDYYTP